MGQVHHGCATTTAAVRRAIQHSQASLRQLAQRYGINPKTVAKWKKRSSTADQKTGPTTPKSTVLSVDDEAIIVAFRRHTLLPLDDCLYALLPTIPHLTRSALHRCLQRHGISRLPEVDGDKPLRSKFKRYPIGYFHIDIVEVHTEEGRLYLLVAIDRTSKFAFVELHEKATRRVAGNFLRALAVAVPYKIHTVLTDNGTHFTKPSGNTWTPEEIKAMRAEKVPYRCHSFEGACADLDIEHRLTKPRHPWTNGQVAPPLPQFVQRLVGAIDAGRISPAQPIAVHEHDAAQHPPIIHRGLPWLLGKNGRSRSICSSVSQRLRIPVSSLSLNQITMLTAMGPDPRTQLS